MSLITEDEYEKALLVLEIARDDVDVTPDESDVLNESHTILQEYRFNSEL